MSQPMPVAESLGPIDHHLIGEGSHLALYRVLGAQPSRRGDVDGVRFAVWAPNARHVAVVGDFNGWNPALNPMRPSDSGIWECFVAGVPAGSHYKYLIESREERAVA